MWSDTFIYFSMLLWLYNGKYYNIIAQQQWCKKCIILHLKCLSFHPEMRGKFWNTIIRNHSFTNPFTRLGCPLLFWTARPLTVTSSVFCSNKHVFISISSGSENTSKRTQRMAFSAAIIATLASSEQGVQHTSFCLINVLHHFSGLNAALATSLYGSVPG